jgi:CheY-like chemotaxis protein
MLSMNDAGYLMGKRILVADDSLTIQKAFAMVMDGSEYVLSFAKTVDEALAAAKANGRPDLVLSDVALGSGSGYDLCAEIKAEPSLRDVPVYILASHQTPYDEARGRKVGADGHMAKPFESQALLDAVASAIASTARPISAVMPQFSADFDDNTARISNQDLPVDDEDSYGEIIIERSPMPPSSASAWGKPPTRPSGARPIPAAATAPAATPAAPRPSLIPGARPPVSMPASTAATTPYPLGSGAAGPGIPAIPAIPAIPGVGAHGPARPAMNRTVMGFPSAKPPVPGKGTPPLAPVRATPSTPMSAGPSRPMVAPVQPPPYAPAPITVKAPTPLPSTAPSAAPPVSGRPAMPRFSAPTPPAGSYAFPGSQARPLPSDRTSEIALSSPLADAVSSAVDRKVAALSARGPEYEAIVRLSREIIEQVVWEVVPELAEAIIRQEVDRLASVKK